MTSRFLGVVIMMDAAIGGKLFERSKEKAAKRGVSVEELMIEPSQNT
jgi:hypothetical protein